MTSRYRIYVDHGLTGANRDRPGLRLALAACRAGGARAKISLPVSALKQDDDALGLINFFATGNRPRPNANYRRSPSAMRTRQVQNALDILAEPAACESLRWLGQWEVRLDVAQPGQTSPRGKGHVTFFTRGWLQVLTDSEIWNWLVWRQLPQVPVREANGAGPP